MTDGNPLVTIQDSAAVAGFVELTNHFQNPLKGGAWDVLVCDAKLVRKDANTLEAQLPTQPLRAPGVEGVKNSWQEWRFETVRPGGEPWSYMDDISGTPTFKGTVEDGQRVQDPEDGAGR